MLRQSLLLNWGINIGTLPYLVKTHYKLPMLVKNKKKLSKIMATKENILCSFILKAL